MVCYIIYCGFIEKCYLRTVNENENGKRKRESAGRSSPLSCRLDVERGGAKGFAHVGALKAMEELGIRPDIISGTSAGAVIAVLYADGYSPDEILDLFSGLSFNDLAEITLPRSCFF